MLLKDFIVQLGKLSIDKQVAFMYVDGETNPNLQVDHTKEDVEKVFVYFSAYVDPADAADTEIAHTAKVMSNHEDPG